MTSSSSDRPASATDRRSFVGGLLSAPFLARKGRAATHGARPDVLMIAIDDLNTWVGFLGGHPQTRTPNLDALARRSFSFDYSYCPVPYCYPTRVATLWGQDPERTGVYVKEGLGQLRTQPSLASRFQSAGYSTHCMGKIYHANPVDRESWDSWVMYDAPRRQWRENTNTPICTFASLPPGPDLQTDWGEIDTLTEMRDYKYVQRLGAVYDRVDPAQPVFSAIGFHEPHTPFFLPPEYWAPFRDLDVVTPDINTVLPAGVPETAQAWTRNPSNFPVLARALCDRPLQTLGTSFIELIRDTNILPELVRGYLASVAFLDDMVGRTLATLEASGRADNTIIVLWSDHGFHLGEKLHWSKFTLWEEATRVPMLVHVPEAVSVSHAITGRSATPVSTIDILATLADLGCFAPPALSDSRSLLPVMAEAPDRRPALTTWGSGNQSIRLGQWRFTRYAKGGHELYDLDADPGSRTNLANDPNYADVKSRLAAALQRRVIS
jgi:arylsulfatase A-like enzyme